MCVPHDAKSARVPKERLRKQWSHRKHLLLLLLLPCAPCSTLTRHRQWAAAPVRLLFAAVENVTGAKSVRVCTATTAAAE